MGFYFRKSVSFGGLRFNFSKSGIGVSAGIKGFRIGMSPRGNYVHIGANGFYYKKMIAQKRSKSRIAEPRRVSDQPQVPSTNVIMSDIESDDALHIFDTDSEEILTEINQKLKKFPLWVLGVVISLLLASTSFIMLGIISIPLLYIVDRKRRITILFYDIDNQTEEKIQKFYDTFNEIMNSNRKWHIEASGHINTPDRKYHGGAGHLLKRSTIHISYATPKFMKTNVKVPCIPVGKQKLYFFPDRVFIMEKGKAGAVSYGKLKLECSNSRFIEDEGVPGDTQVVGHTWRFVNKSGGPDKRFNNNKQIPVCLYSELLFYSDTGLNEKIQVSKPDLGKSLMEYLNHSSFSYVHEKVSLSPRTIS